MWPLIPILIYTLIFMYVRHVYSHWYRKGFPTERVGLTWRYFKQVYKREFQHVDAVSEAYCSGREPFLGIYFFFRPMLLVRDMSLARTILENTSGHFNNPKWEYIKGCRKMNLLEKLAPMFNLPRTESMFRGMEKIADYMVEHLKTSIEERETMTVDLQHILRVYSINVIGNFIYGLDSNNFEHADCIFSNYSKSRGRNCSLNSFTLSHISTKSSLTYRLRDIIRDSVDRREEGGYIRKDILQLLVKFRNGNEIAGVKNQNWYIENIFGSEKVLSIKRLSKIAEIFLNMGLETMASAIVLTFYEVLREPQILKKLLKEIDGLQELKTADNKPLSYASLNGLEYLDVCIQETLRKYPGVPIIERVCRKNYNIPGSRFTILEGKTIMIPLMAIQRDEKYFEEPLKYKPERFLNCENTKQEAFMGFGLGSGTCVARVFSKMVIKLAIVKLLQNFHMTLAESKEVELVHSPTPSIKSKDGLKVILKNHTIKPTFYL